MKKSPRHLRCCARIFCRRLSTQRIGCFLARRGYLVSRKQIRSCDRNKRSVRAHGSHGRFHRYYVVGASPPSSHRPAARARACVDRFHIETDRARPLNGRRHVDAARSPGRATRALRARPLATRTPTRVRASSSSVHSNTRPGACPLNGRRHVDAARSPGRATRALRARPLAIRTPTRARAPRLHLCTPTMRPGPN